MSHCHVRYQEHWILRDERQHTGGLTGTASGSKDEEQADVSASAAADEEHHLRTGTAKDDVKTEKWTDGSKGSSLHYPTTVGS